MKKLVVATIAIAAVITAGSDVKPSPTSANTIQQNVIFDKVVSIHGNTFETQYGWENTISKRQPVHVGNTVELQLNTNGHSPNYEDWYTDGYTVVKSYK